MAKRRCRFCGDDLPKDARPNRVYCGDDCRRGRTKPPAPADPDVVLGEIAAALEQSISEAKKLNRLGKLDAGAVAALRVLARQIDEKEARWVLVVEWHRESGTPMPKPPPGDNVMMPTFLKFCDALGLTPHGRGQLAPAPKGGDGGSKLGGHLAAVPKPDVG